MVCFLAELEEKMDIAVASSCSDATVRRRLALRVTACTLLMYLGLIK